MAAVTTVAVVFRFLSNTNNLTEEDVSLEGISWIAKHHTKSG
jgi:hypothetical protein